MREVYDVAVIGAGPAGSAFARLAPGNLKIAIIDKRNLDENQNFIRSKCCGGLLAPSAQKELAGQGLGIPGYVLAGPQTFSVRSIDLDNNSTRFYRRNYINIDREKLDRWLISLIPAESDFFFSSVLTSIEKEDGHWVMNLSTPDGNKTIISRYLVAADGADSFVRRKTGGDHPLPLKYISIQDTYITERTYPYYISIFDHKTTDFYSWMIQKGEHILFGSAIPVVSDAVKKHDELAAELISGDLLSGRFVERNGSIINRTVRNRQILLAGENVFYIGEAAGLISPSSAEGISYALKSGRKLADAFASGKDIRKKYCLGMNKVRAGIIVKNAKSRVMYSRSLRNIIMKSGFMSMHVDEKNESY